MLSIQSMLESGVHFGHQVRRWNPKMDPYIYGERNGIHIIDVIQTRRLLENVCQYLQKNTNSKTNILFVGTTLQASAIVEDVAKKCSSNYVNQRWLGGMLTNWETMQTCIQKLSNLEREEEMESYQKLPKKEIAIRKKRKEKLQKYFGGMKTMTRTPDLVVIVGQPRELNAVKECRQLNIKTITILDTNCDPSFADLFIPANDDSIQSITLILNQLGESISEARNL